MTISYGKRTSVAEVEEGISLTPRFGVDGLIPVIVTDARDNAVLMLGYMNAEAFELTIRTLQGHYFSRSRQAIWRKGETSGLVHSVQQVLVDDDQDCIWLRVSIPESGASCHVGYRSCFYREVEVDRSNPPVDCHTEVAAPRLRFIESQKIFDADSTYAGLPNPTRL